MTADLVYIVTLTAGNEWHPDRRLAYSTLGAAQQARLTHQSSEGLITLEWHYDTLAGCWASQELPHGFQYHVLPLLLVNGETDQRHSAQPGTDAPTTNPGSVTT